MVHASAALLLYALLALPAGADRADQAVARAGDGAAVRAEEKKGGAEEVRTLFAAESNAICGGGEIRRMLTEVPNDASFRCSKWSSIKAVAEAYLKDVDTEIKRLVAEVERLEKEIEFAREKTAPQRWDINGAAKPLLEGIITESYKSVNGAAKSKCGGGGWRVRRDFGVPNGAFDAADVLMKQKLDEVFRPGDLRIGNELEDENALSKMCATMVEWDGQEDKKSYCDELCTHFAQGAIAASGEYGGSYAGPGVQQLQEQHAKAVADLKYNQDEEAECQRARTSLEKFSAELVALNKDIDAKHTARMAAQEALDEAGERLDKLEGQANGYTEDLEAAQGKLGLSTKKAADLTAAVAAAKLKETAAHAAAKKAAEALEAASLELKKAEDATVAMDVIKGLVSQSLLRMFAYYDIVVIQPVIDLGLELATNIEEYFQNILSDKELDEKQGVFDTLTSMDKFCAEEAKPAFEKVKETVDLTPICGYGAAQDTANKVQALVKARAIAVQAAFKDMQNAIDPYRGQEGMSKQTSDELTAAGEPKGLREIATVFAESSYYSKYVVHWRMDAQPPKFLDLLAKLREKLEALTEQKTKLVQALKEAQEAAAAQVQAAKAVAGQLKEAIAQNAVDQGKVAEVQALLKAQEEKIEEAEGNLDDLEAALNAAEKAYEDARLKLKETHKMGTNLA